MVMVDPSRTDEDDEVSLAEAMLRRLELQDQKIADLIVEVAALKAKADENAEILTSIAELWTQMAEMTSRLRSDVRRT